MIRSYNDHAANERTFLAWVRTGLSAIALGVVVERSSAFAAVGVPDASSATLSERVISILCNDSAIAFVGLGVAVMLGAGIRFVRNALRIDDQDMHSADVVQLACSLLRRYAGRRRADASIGAKIPRLVDGRATLRQRWGASGGLR